jgi:hypothetical protein
MRSIDVAVLHRILYFILILMVCVGCSTQTMKPPLAQSDSEGPYQLRIDDEVFDGKKLFIKVAVEQLTSSVQAPSVIRLKTMHNGADVGESFVPFDEQQQGDALQLSADAEGFTDYQVDLLWGADAESFLKAIPASHFIVVRDTALITDATGSRITGTIENTGHYPVSNTPLTVEFQWVKQGEFLDLSVHDPEATTELTLSDITIEPKQSRSFAIALESSPPPREGEQGTWQVIVKSGTVVAAESR